MTLVTFKDALNEFLKSGAFYIALGIAIVIAITIILLILLNKKKNK